MATVPWHVVIYKNSSQICGGTIVSERVVITAAHCFANETQNMDYEIFKVAAGKMNRALDVMDSPDSQIRDILKVVIPSR